MAKKVLDVGNCRPDHAAIRYFLEGMGLDVEQAHLTEQALQRLRESPFDLVLVNRKLDHDYSDGTELIQAMKADPALRSIPVMLISNYADAQAEAVRLGALHGFGKLELSREQTRVRVREALSADGGSQPLLQGQHRTEN